MAAVDATDCAIDGTVNDASLDVLAFDCAGAAGDKSLISVGAIFDAMTMDCFKFDSSLGGLETAFVFSNDFAGFTALLALISKVAASAFLVAFLLSTTVGLAISLVAALTAGFISSFAMDFAAVLTAGLLTDFVPAFAEDLTTGLTIFLATGLGADFTTAFLTGLTTALTVVLVAVLAMGLAGFTVLFAATFVTALAATLMGAFLTTFFATVFIHCLPAMLVFIQIKQSTHTHQKTNAFTLKLLRIYLSHLVINKYSNIAKIQSARGL